jgi:hypothetical protein
VSEAIYEPNPGDGDNDNAVDIDAAFGDESVDELIDQSYSPPERSPEYTRYGTTVEEQRAGESLEQRLAQEEPDPNASVELDGGRFAGDTPVPDDIDTGSGELPDDEQWDGVLDDGEVGDARAGRLVDPDEGLSEDREKDLIGADVGIDAGAASAEEAAMHIVGESEADWSLRRESGRPEY